MKKLLNEIAEVTAGQGAPQGDENYSIDGTPFVKAGNLYDLINGESIDSIQKVNDDIANKYRLKKFPAGTVVFAKSGMSCLKSYVYVLPTEAYVVNHLACIVPDLGLSEYLKFYFMHHKPSELIKDSSYPSIRLSDISDKVINLPELSECMNIVKILNNTERVIKIKKLQLLEFDQLIKSRFVEMFGDPMHKSDKFIYSTYGDKFQLNAGGTPSKSNPEYWNGGTISWIGSNLCQNVVLNNNDGKFITEEGYKNSSARLFPVDTVLIALVGATIGKTALLKFETTTNQNVLGVRGIEEAGYNPYFVYMYTQGLYQKFIDIGDGGFNMASKAFISELYIPEVNINLQNQYADFFKQVDKLKFEVKKSLDETQKLFDSLMQEYFG